MRMDPVQAELLFLRHFYEEAGEAFGPADSEIYEMIKQSYVDQGGTLPPGYELDE